MSLLEVRNLIVEFPNRRGTLRALDDVSFEIAPGEILGVVGESGAGKSLTGASIIGLLEPPGRVASGQIVLEGQRIDQLSHEQMRHIRGRKIGAIFQDPLTSLNPLYSVGRQLVETIQTHLPVSAAEARQRAIDLLKDTGIPAAEQRIDHYPHQFSGGMRQRVVIALALAAEPKLIVADEPTTALDVSIQAQIIGLLKRVCRERGAAVMLITHDMGAVAEMTDRVAVMYAGHVVESGAVDEVLRQPLHPYTRGLIACAPGARTVAPGQMLDEIPGTVPSLVERGPGCLFAERCPQALHRRSHPRGDGAGGLRLGEQQLPARHRHHEVHLQPLLIAEVVDLAAASGRQLCLDQLAGDEALVDVQEGGLLARRELAVLGDRATDIAARTLGDGVVVEDPGLDVERLRRDLQPLGQLLEDLRTRALEATLDLREVRIGDAGKLRELTQAELGGLTLLAQVVAEAAAQVVQRVLAHASIVLALVSRMQTQGSVSVVTSPSGTRDPIRMPDAHLSSGVRSP